MKHNMLLTGLVVVGFGCQSLPLERDMQPMHDASEVHEDNGPASQTETAGTTDMPVVGFTSLGEVVIFDGRTGDIQSTVAGGGGVPRDVAMDPWREGVWVYEENADASGGEIRFCPLERLRVQGQASALPMLLRPCEHAVWIDGNAAVLPMAEGLWVFEDGIGGPRWKVLRDDGVLPSMSAPRPASISVQNGEIEAFSWGVQNDRQVLLRANLGFQGPEVTEAFDGGKPSGYPPTARYAWVSHDAGLIFDAVSKALTVRRVTAAETGLAMVIDVGMPVSRIEAVATAGRSTLVLGTDALWIVETHEGPEPGVEFMAGLWLHGDARDSSLFFSRELLVTPERAFVGTDRGVRAVALENDGGAIVNAYMDEEFVGAGIRGPLDAVRPIGW